MKSNVTIDGQKRFSSARVLAAALVVPLTLCLLGSSCPGPILGPGSGSGPGHPRPCDPNCDDDAFCNGVEECVEGACVPGTPPCPSDRTCDEDTDTCTFVPAPTCRSAADCDDDFFCNGAEQCVRDACLTGSRPCGPNQMCLETESRCVNKGSFDCDVCDDGIFCNGAESCIVQDDFIVTCLGPLMPPCLSNERCDEENERCVSSPPPVPIQPTVGVANATACNGVTTIEIVFGTDVQGLIESIELGGEVVLEADLDPVPARFTGPLSMAFVMDQSLSMDDSDPSNFRFEAASLMFDLFEPLDEAALLDFARSVRRLHAMTMDEESLKATVLALASEGTRGYTAFYDAVMDGLAVIGEQASNADRAVVILSDGKDNASTASEDDAISAVVSAGVPVFTVGLTDAIDPESLTHLAFSTGGIYFAAFDITTLARSYTTIVELLQGHARVSSALFAGEYLETQTLTIHLTDGRSVVLPDMLFVRSCSVPPEEILADPVVQAALDEFRALGFEFNPSVAVDPPDIAGTYRRELRAGVFIATHNGTQVGVGMTGAETTYTNTGPLELSYEGFSFTSDVPTVSVYDGAGVFIRGVGSDFTLYSRGWQTCVEADSDYRLFGVGITIGSVDPSTGDLVDVTEFDITTETAGDLTDACASRIVADAEHVGGWGVFHVDRLYRLESPSTTPTIGLSLASLNFSATQGGASPANKTIQLTNTGGGTLNWSVSDNVAWLSVTPTSGSTTTETDSLTVSVSAAGLTAAASPYTATITVNSADAGNAPQVVSVGLTVTPSSSPTTPTIRLSPASLFFSATQGGANPASKSIQLTNAGSGTLHWSVSDNVAWLSVTPTSGSTTTETDSLTVSVNATGLTAAASPYTATITVNSADAGNAPQVVSVGLTVTPSSSSGCSSVGDCDDDLFCNGQETCNTATRACRPGTSPCSSGQTCDEAQRLCRACNSDADCGPCLSCEKSRCATFTGITMCLCEDDCSAGLSCLELISGTRCEVWTESLCGELALPGSEEGRCGRCVSFGLCGWCSADNTCRAGHDNGPSTGGVCGHWAFSPSACQ